MFLEKTIEEWEKKNKMAVGFDLRNDVTQISFCMLNQSIPDTYSMTAGEETYDLPTVMCRKMYENQDGTGKEQWFIGKEALELSKKHEGILVEDLILLGKSEQNVLVGETQYPIVDILEKYLKKCLFLVAPGERLEDIVSISFVLKDRNPVLIQNIRQAINHLQDHASQISFMTYEDCFFQYMLHQPEEMWIHDVVMYDYRMDGIYSYYLRMNRNVMPIVATIQKNSFPQMKMSDLERLEKDARRAYLSQLDESFLEICHSLCDGNILTSVFLIGEQFSTEWCKQSIKYLCGMGRVFQGTNLYSKGACYGAREKVAPSSLCEKFCYLSEEKLMVNIGLLCRQKGEDITKTLLPVGTDWHDASVDVDLLLLRNNKITIVISPIDGKKPKVAEVTLENYEIRGNRTNRIGLHLEMKDKKTVVIEVKDKGFGDFFASTGQVWHEELTIENGNGE